MPIGDSDWIISYGLDPKLLEMDEPTCDFSGCNERSVQYFMVLCCKSVYFMCTAHVNQTLYMIKSLSETQGVTCKHCSLRWNSLDFITVPRPLALED